MLGDVLHLDRVAQVRLVGAVFAQRLGERDARPALGHRLALGEILEHAGDHRLHRREHVLLLDEAHLDVELIELAGQTVGARILVAEARRDLEVAVEARHHQQLLVLLRRLRQGVELAGMDARRHQEVARALRRGRGQDRRLEFEEALLLHAPAHRIDDRAAGHDVLVQLLAAQIEEAVFQPDVLGILLLAEHRQRQLGGGAQHLDVGDVKLDLAGRQLGIVGALGAAADLALHAHDPFRAQLLGEAERLGIGIDDALGDAVMVAQVDEQHATMVADAMAPAGQPDRLSDVAVAERAAGMGPVAMHGRPEYRREEKESGLPQRRIPNARWV